MDVSLTLLAIMFGNKFVSESKKEKKKKTSVALPICLMIYQNLYRYYVLIVIIDC